jgi:hypothetical protein
LFSFMKIPLDFFFLHLYPFPPKSENAFPVKPVYGQSSAIQTSLRFVLAPSEYITCFRLILCVFILLRIFFKTSMWVVFVRKHNCGGILLHTPQLSFNVIFFTYTHLLSLRSSFSLEATRGWRVMRVTRVTRQAEKPENPWHGEESDNSCT